MRKEKNIGIDFDDVIFDMSNHLLDYFNKRYKTEIKRSDITRYEMGFLWDIRKEEENKVIMDFCFSELHHGTLPVKGAIEGINKLSERNTLFVVTAREDVRKEMTHRWLDEYLPNIFKSVIFTNHNHEDPNLRRTKAEICQELGIEYFIDDSLANVTEVGKVVKKVYLLDAPWNQGELLSNVKRVFSWEEIVADLL